VVGSQIVGAKPTEALPVTVVGSADIETMAIASGDDLFRSIPQLGDVGFNTSRTIGSVNDARGDTASINLRALGTGNTLVLLNGRRMVNHPGTQSENLTPVVTVNANAIPVTGVSRVEVLLDGASAIYGADAVAGVVNTVLKTDFEGLTAEAMIGSEEGGVGQELSASLQFGINSDDKRTNLSIFGSYFSRDPIYARDRDFTANADLTGRLPANWAGQSQFNNTSTTSAWGGFDRYSSGNIVVNGTAVTNSSGQFHIQPDTLPGCLGALANGLCIDDSSTRDAALRYNVNDVTTVSNGVDRINLFSFLNHEFDGGTKLFIEAGVYHADSLGYREEAPMLGAVPIVIPASNYYNPFGPVGSPNRLPGFAGPAQGLDLSLVGYRAVDAGPRKTEVENLSTRLLAGFKGNSAGWDWDTALLYTRADSEDNENRVSNTLFQEALGRSTPDAYNPFNGGCLDNLQNGDCTPTLASTIDDITVNVYRRNSTSLASWDAKFSRPDLISLWAGDVGIAAGVELRRETFSDDRDPRLDGTVNFVDSISGLVASDVMGQSSTLDTKGSRNVQSAFVELAVPLVSPDMNIPLAQSVDMQLAVRHENFDEFGGVTKPKVALSWRPADFLLFRSAWSEGFRAPNLQQQFENGLQRSNVRTDWVQCEIAARNGDVPSVTGGNCGAFSGSTISNRAGSLSLKPEESENFTAGFVIESTFLPRQYGKLSFTADWWEIKQTNVIGIFGDDNQLLLDYALRVQGSSNPAVVRAAPTTDQITAAQGTGLDPVGDVLYVDDNYRNLYPRDVRGVDLGFYYDIDSTPLGDFNFRINAAYLDKFFQEPSPQGDVITAAQAAGDIPDLITVGGEANLVRNFGRPEWRWTSAVTWRKGAFGAGWFTSYVGSVLDFDIVRASDNAVWQIDDYQTHNLYVQYTLGEDTDKPMRIRVGARNIFDETPPLADTNYGYLGDLHNPAGRFFYASVRKQF
jgi:iron complex outermembrane recepter protein